MMTEEHFDNFADNTTKSSVGKLPNPLPIFSFKRHLSLYENTAARRVSRRQSALLFHDRTNSLDSPNTKVKLIGNLNFCLSVILRKKCMFSFLGVIF